jgi:nucleoside-diphosphate-sugar epimerase
VKRIAVTGANGFVGRHVVAHAVGSGYGVVGVVRSEAAAQLVRLHGGQPVQIVGRDPEALVRALDGCSAIVHLAQVGAERSGQTYEGVNVTLTERVLEDARHAGVPRIVYFSGLGVASYGRRRRCSNPYFLSKLAAETILFRSGIEGVVFRPSYVVGPGDSLVATVVQTLAERSSGRETALTACSRSRSPTRPPSSSPRRRGRQARSRPCSTSSAPKR